MKKQFKAAVVSLGSKSSLATIEAMQEYFEQVDDLQIRDVEVVLGQKQPLLYQGESLSAYDCIYVKGSYRYAAIGHALTKALSNVTYMPTRAEAFHVVHDKILTHIAMQQEDIPMPKTYVSATVKAAKKLLGSLHYPIIMKFPKGTHGKGVMFADSFPAASSILDALDSLRQSFMIQEYVETGGVDIRAFVVGDRVVAAMKRKASGSEKRANVHAGGLVEGYEVSAEVHRVAIKAARAIGADICGVDILETHRGPVVIEANISPGIQGIVDATKRNVPGEIAKYLFMKTSLFKERKAKPQAQQILDEEKKSNTIFGALDFRAGRILLPSVVTKSSGIGEDDDCTVTAQKGKIEIKKGI